MSADDGKTAPEGVDLEHPNPARIYDWFLGGRTNWAIDREFGAKAVETFPMVRQLAKMGREFLGRGVQYLSEQGVRQFLDLGSGVPTVGNVHEIADAVNPDSRCVYVDNEPVAVAHSRVVLENHGDPARHAVLHGDLRDVEDVWERALDTGVLNPNEPIGLIVASVLYFFGPEDDPYGVVARYRDLLPSGSYLLSTHLTLDGEPEGEDDARAAIRRQYARESSQLYMRSREEFGRFFDGFELVEPGIAWVPEWHPELRPAPVSEEYADDPSGSSAYGAVGRKP